MRLRLLCSERFLFRGARGCTRSDASCVGWSVKLRSGLGNDFAVNFDELIYTLSCDRRESVLIEVVE